LPKASRLIRYLQGKLRPRDLPFFFLRVLPNDWGKRETGKRRDKDLTQRAQSPGAQRSQKKSRSLRPKGLSYSSQIVAGASASRLKNQACENQPHRSSHESSGMGQRCMKQTRKDGPKAFFGIRARPPGRNQLRPLVWKYKARSASCFVPSFFRTYGAKY
jgi:hypothetical protein